MLPQSNAQSNGLKDDARVTLKCSKCSKIGRKTCSQQACIKCCTDDQCEGHREQREKDKEKLLIIEGRHPLQLYVKRLRASAVKPGLFRETAFRYHGETLLIWDLQTFMKNPKWRDDAVRKSRRYVETQLYNQSHKTSNSRRRRESRSRRFKNIMDYLYQQSLK
mmetsp:Transcript_3568/g.6749  ORF Transcript_3568/g.6749 Transcript_3568/m.6749 type:complete len:164 (+) Transcript_3568:162-653(+)